MRLIGLHAVAVVAAFALQGGCAEKAARPQSAQRDAPPAEGASILEMSVPAAGSTVKSPVDELMLHFNLPVRLDEVTVVGPQGLMPMMITPFGDVQHYSLPLSGLGSGAYTITWRATAQGREYRGSFGFTAS